MQQYDIVIVGSGAGLMVLEEALRLGLRCAMIEKGKFGGTCLTKGCIPSKMLVYPADLIREIEAAGRIGIETASPNINWDVISQRMWEQIDFHQTIEQNLQDMPGLTLYKGTGAFTGPNTMRVSYDDGRADEELCAEKFILAPGARSFVPDIKGLKEAGYLTSESFFGSKYPKAPWKSLVILGGGTIAAEFAHIFSAFGTKVTVVARSGLLGKEEPEIVEFVEKTFAESGIDVRKGFEVLEVGTDGAGKWLTLRNRQTQQEERVACGEILVASGVQSTGDALQLQNAGVEVDSRGWIRTNAYLETNQPHIWALGDINGKYQLRHKANHEAQVLSWNLFSGQPKREVSYHAVPWTIFTHPQVSRVGKTEQELQQQKIPYRVAKNHYSEVVGGRAMGFRTGASDDGFVKMLVGEDKKILGVHIVGPQSAVLLQPFVYLMNTGFQCQKQMIQAGVHNELAGLRLLCPQVGTYAPIYNSMIIHPSLNELTAWVFEKFDEAASPNL